MKLLNSSKYSVFLLLTLLLISGCSVIPTEKQFTKMVVSTEYGDMTFKLYNETPLHRDNFIKLIKKGYFNDLLFHRVIKGFMIQGGDPDSRNAVPGKLLGEGGPGYQINAEFVKNIYHKRGALAAAREGDRTNPERKSAGSQFYIVQGKVFTNDELDKLETSRNIKLNSEQREIYCTVGGTPHLDGKYTVFGEMISGWEVLDSIASVKTDGNDRPLKNFTMKIKILKK